MGNFAKICLCRERGRFFFIYHAERLRNGPNGNYMLKVCGEYTNKYTSIMQFVETNLEKNPTVYYHLKFGRQSIPLKFMEEIVNLVENHNKTIKKVTLDGSLDS